MFIALAIGIPIFLLFGGALLALGFSVSDEPEPEAAKAQTTVEQPGQRALFFGPMGWAAGAQDLTTEELIASIEDHLRQENRLASAFARDPSARTLWLEDRPPN